MQLKWLEDLLALAEAGSFVRAAQRRHVTHPAFGRRIRALEAWAGAALIDRDAPALRFTPQGIAVLEAARDALAALAVARHAHGGGVEDERPIHVAPAAPSRAPCSRPGTARCTGCSPSGSSRSRRARCRR